jgi:hypothetical protein
MASQTLENIITRWRGRGHGVFRRPQHSCAWVDLPSDSNIQKIIAHVVLAEKHSCCAAAESVPRYQQDKVRTIPPRLPSAGVFSRSIFYFLLLVLLQACANVRTPSAPMSGVANADPSPDFFVPSGVFEKSANDTKQATGVHAIAGLPLPSFNAAPIPFMPEVVLYASPTTQVFFESGKLDFKTNVQFWEVFLRKYKIPFELATSVSQLESSRAGVLVLPSSVALSQREKQTVINFRARGGSVLASWLSGVRDEHGAWQGFEFMENTLDVKVLGNTAADEDDNFMMPHGDSPVTHYLPAGLRIWLERAKEWHPLRLASRNPAAHIMDWSRRFVVGKATAAITFDERTSSTGRSSRSVILGYPERLWVMADPKLLEAIAHNSLMWLLHQPSAYVAAWPHPHASAFVLAVDASEIIDETDISFAKSFEDIGGRATYYSLSDNAVKSAAMLKTLQARGHELAYMGDKFVGFKDQSAAAQANRLDAMRKAIKAAGLDLSVDAGFHAPMESYDKNTEKLMLDRAFGHYVATPASTDARLPFFAPVDANAAQSPKATVVLPRTQAGSEAAEEGEPAEGMKAFLGEMELSEKMAGLSVVRMPNQSLLTKDELGEILQHIKARRDRTWLATANQVANWWRERERVSIRLEAGAVAPLLTVTVKGETPLQQGVTVWVNLPESGSTLRLIANGKVEGPPKITAVDAWRAAVVLTGLAPGSHSWQLQFDRLASGTR